MGLETDNLFRDEEDEFFTKESDDAFRSKVKRKTITQTVDSGTTGTTLVNDDELFMTLSPESTYTFRVILDVDSQSTPLFKWKFTVPEGVTGSYNADLIDKDAVEVQSAVVSDLTTIKDTNDMSIGNNIIKINGIIETGTTSGNIQLQWAQLYSSANDTSVLVNSYMVIIKQ